MAHPSSTLSSAVLHLLYEFAHTYNMSLSDATIFDENLEQFVANFDFLTFRYTSTDRVNGSRATLPPLPTFLGSARIETIYTYTPVPEPGSGSLLAAGVLMLSRVRASRRR